MVIYSLLAFVLGISTALVELLSRYRDEPFKVIATSQFAWVYLLLNGFLAVAADAILVSSPYGDHDSAGGRAMLAVMGGLGAAVILRSRVFTAQLGDEQVSIGPGYVVDQLLSIIDAQIDRRRALQRVKIVVEVMKDKDFEGAKSHASTMITGSRQNLTLQAQQELANQIREISDRKIPDQERCYALGFVLLDFMGEDFLRQVANELPTLAADAEVVAVAQIGGGPPKSIVQTGELTRTGKIVARNWDASLPVQRADLVRELLSGVSLGRLNARISELMGRKEIGRSEGERLAMLNEIDRVLSRDDTSEEDKIFGLGFVIHEHVDRRTFREFFGDLQLLESTQIAAKSLRAPATRETLGKTDSYPALSGESIEVEIDEGDDDDDDDDDDDYGQEELKLPDSGRGRRAQPGRASRSARGARRPNPRREDSNADRPITGRHPTIGAPAGPMPAASSTRLEPPED
ncbi:hypothetical protein G6O69_25425 [Pseudenhygromyxa sp. WMMC2535]|uniref:hypothetical protein n=1 Tax=Pseudenhygromyxa sp. WMMC2535 TaxID=2712867 RepID=UPI001595BD42|nr:hypothetical protein [Pseudenhygromyxa sp. WMMC2535]NVB41205.1 hypothetical protein [Pseudenhygromyxa sp. WMMC2535]